MVPEIEEERMNLLPCPRCGFRSYEKLKTHDHCANCNYSSEFHIEPVATIPQWAKHVPDGVEVRDACAA